MTQWKKAVGLAGGVALIAGLILYPRFNSRPNHDRLYRIGYGRDFPLHFKGTNGNPTGFAVELVRDAAARRGVKLDWIAGDGMDDTKADLWVLMTIHPERVKHFHFTKPFLQTYNCLLVADASPAQSVKDLQNPRISFLGFDIHRRNLTNLFARFREVPASSSQEALAHLVAGRADAAYLSEFAARSALMSGGFLTPLRWIPTHVPKSKLAIAATPAAAAVADEIRAEIGSMVEDGTVQTLAERWAAFSNLTTDLAGEVVTAKKRIATLSLVLTIMSALLLLTLWLALHSRRQNRLLRQKENRYRAVVQLAADGFWSVDIEGRLIDVNEAYCGMSGYARQELLTMHISDLEAGDTPSDPAGRIQNVLLHKRQRFETRHRRKDGSAYDVEVSIQYEAEGGGRMFAFLRDVSERNRAEQALREREAKFRAILENSHDGILFTDAAFKLLYRSPSFQRITGHPDEARLGHIGFDIIHPDDLQAFHCAWDEMARQPKTLLQTQYRIRHRDGTWLWLETTAQNLLDDPNVRAVVLTSHDITQHKQAEASLREREFWLSESQRIGRVGSYALDIHSGVWTSSAVLDDLLGLEAGAPKTVESWNALVHPEDRQTMLDYFVRDVVGAKHTFDKEYRIVRVRDGQVRWMWGRGELTYDGTGAPATMIGTIQDVTDRKALEERLRQAQKLEAVGQLAGGVAHDFNNMLAATLLHLGLLQQRANLDAETRETVAELIEDTHRTARLTKQLLMFSRRSRLEIKVLDLNQIVAGLLNMLNRLIGEQVTIQFAPNPDVPPIAADRGMMEQVLMNLCVNARDAMPDGGRLTITLETVQVTESRAQLRPGLAPGPFACLSVADTGCGMDEATLRRIFEPFFTTKEPGKGTGLGLATVHGIVGQHKGWTEAESKLGQGATFRVFLPAASRAQVDAGGVGKLKAVSGHGTILLVEDDPAVRRVTFRSLNALGYRVFVAADARQALELWKDHRAETNLLLSDMVMPGGISGMDLAKQLLLDKPDLKVIISSGYSAEIGAEGPPDPPGIIRLQKPVALEVLSRTLRQCLSGTASQPVSES